MPITLVNPQRLLLLAKVTPKYGVKDPMSIRLAQTRMSQQWIHKNRNNIDSYLCILT